MKSHFKNKIRMIIFLIVLSLATKSQTRVLDIQTNTQPTGSNWCWASSTFMAARYYGSNTSECQIVEWARLNINFPNRGSINCCNTPIPSECLSGLYISDLDDVLASQNLISLWENVVSLNTVQTTINDNRPLIIQGFRAPYSWHTMIIIGYDGNLLHYNDPAGGAYITAYNNAITLECMGQFLYRWEESTHILTNRPCPINLNLTQRIDANANINAQNNISLSCEIGNNRNIILRAGSVIDFISGFFIPLGSTLSANIVSNPCQ